ncbi:hypothetical protein Tco_0998809 [Tanacetum coccineum]
MVTSVICRLALSLERFTYCCLTAVEYRLQTMKGGTDSNYDGDYDQGEWDRFILLIGYNARSRRQLWRSRFDGSVCLDVDFYSDTIYDGIHNRIRVRWDDSEMDWDYRMSW